MASNIQRSAINHKMNLPTINYTHLLYSATGNIWIPQYNTYSYKWIDKDQWYNNQLYYMTPSLVDSSQISTKRFHCSTTCMNLEPHEVYNTTHAQCCEGYDRLNDKVLIDNILLDSSSSCEFYKYIRKNRRKRKDNLELLHTLYLMKYCSVWQAKLTTLIRWTSRLLLFLEKLETLSLYV